MNIEIMVPKKRPSKRRFISVLKECNTVKEVAQKIKVSETSVSNYAKHYVIL